MRKKKYTTKDVRRLLKMVRTQLLNGGISQDDLDMERFMIPKCGRPGCIGGWALYFDKRRKGEIMELADRSDANDERLYDLMFNFPTRRITPKGAASAITRYLDGKKPWRTPRVDEQTGRLFS